MRTLNQASAMASHIDKFITATMVVALLAIRSTVAHGQQGTITGRVTAQGTNEPLAETRVILVGTSLFTTTGSDGHYTLRNSPSGAHEVRVLRVGFQEQKKPVTVDVGQTATLDFAM